MDFLEKQSGMVATKAQRSDESARSPGACVTGHCEQPGLGVENQTSPLQEQWALLTTEPTVAFHMILEKLEITLWDLL